MSGNVVLHPMCFLFVALRLDESARQQTLNYETNPNRPPNMNPLQMCTNKELGSMGNPAFSARYYSLPTESFQALMKHT